MNWTKIKENSKEIGIKILALLGVLWISSMAVTAINEKTEREQYSEMVRNGDEHDRFEKAIPIASGVYVSTPFDPGNGINFVEVWDYNGKEEVHYFRPVGEN